MNNDLMNFAEVKVTYSPRIKPSERLKLTTSEETYQLLKQVFDINTIEYRESFKLVLLNRAMKVIGITSISEGGIECVSVDIRLIFQTALLANASCFIICHNHPSGNQQPSIEDRNLTRTIHEAGKLLNIILIDHIIVTSEGYYSFSDNGIL